jgi:hypothetical protein
VDRVSIKKARENTESGLVCCLEPNHQRASENPQGILGMTLVHFSQLSFFLGLKKKKKKKKSSFFVSELIGNSYLPSWLYQILETEDEKDA